MTFNKESKLRSAIKSLSWRLIAIIDTVMIVLIITCSVGACSIKQAIAIGFYEFVIKFVVYYVHERIWQGIKIKNRGNKWRTIYKTVSWRVFATVITFIIAGAVLEDLNGVALAIAIVEIFTKTILYYFHERLWLVLPLGRVRKLFYGEKNSG